MENGNDVASGKIERNFSACLNKTDLSFGKPWTFPGVQDYSSQVVIYCTTWGCVRNINYQAFLQIY